eukprot:g2800.t1
MVDTRNFASAWQSLLSLQSTGSALEQSFQQRAQVLRMMNFYTETLGLDTSALSVIHVAGTKGKGSTCAFAESILRAHGHRTGFFSSPHLVHVRERFRINGRVVAEGTFLEHFWAVWDGLKSASAAAEQAGVPPMPSFFRFLTLIAFRLFRAERVDVLLLEVGMGGRLDATNVVERPVCVGVSTLDLDHTHVLGDTLAAIAREKAGVFKPGVPAFTLPQHDAAAVCMLARCAADVGCSLRVVRAAQLLGADAAIMATAAGAATEAGAAACGASALGLAG